MRFEFATALITIVVVCITPQKSSADSFNVVTGFNDTGIQPQPGDPFTYGTEPILNGPFTLFSNFVNTNCTGGECTGDGTIDAYSNGTGFFGPTTAKVATGTTLNFCCDLVVPNNVLVLAPGSYAGLALNVTRFTAPSTGVYDITGSFSDLQFSSVGLYILVNGVTDFSSSAFTGSSAHQPAIPFSLTDISLTAGMTIDFVVDSLGDQSNDVVGLQADISSGSGTAAATPLPAALPLFASGLGAMGLLGWRRKRKARVRKGQ